MKVINDPKQSRGELNFVGAARDHFAFLKSFDFREVEALPTLLRFQKDDVEVTLYHGRRSYELGFEINWLDGSCSLCDIIRYFDSDKGSSYQNYQATTAAQIVSGLSRLSGLVRQFCGPALNCDASFFEALRQQRELWTEKYWLEMRASQVRPKAETAFRNRDYQQAAFFYDQIRACLSATELKKLALAKSRAKV
ncbi:MAG: hypothetical protein ING71_09150 [Rhodocyclaceae bacterium]|nr:hypothetical protein [Rhodocyclaceae bacterium]